VRRSTNADVVDEEDDVTDHPVYRMVYGEFHDSIIVLNIMAKQAGSEARRRF
jgi:hypothetical protein